MLNDEVVYAAIAAIAAAFPEHSGDFAILRSYVYTQWTGSPDLAVPFRNARSAQFWRRCAILVPIFYEQHWMAACIFPEQARIDFFDSFASDSQAELHGGVCSHRRSSPARSLLSEPCTNGLRPALGGPTSLP